MNNVSDIIEALGGCSLVAKAIGRGVSAVSEMKRRGTIPVVYWPAITAEAARKGLPITNDRLVAVHTVAHGAFMSNSADVSPADKPLGDAAAIPPPRGASSFSGGGHGATITRASVADGSTSPPT